MGIKGTLVIYFAGQIHICVEHVTTSGVCARVNGWLMGDVLGGQEYFCPSESEGSLQRQSLPKDISLSHLLLLTLVINLKLSIILREITSFHYSYFIFL